MIAATATALWEDAPGAAIVAGAILVLFAGAEGIRRAFGTPVEWTRKGAHIGAGAIVLSFPWVLEHTATLVLLALAFAGLLIGGRLTGLLGSIHDVERKTAGAYYYPFAVLGAWVLSEGDPLLYCVPLAVMAVADTGAALVGQKAGERTYRVMDGTRSLEGSITFFVLAFGIVLCGCAIAGRPGWPEMLLVTLVAAGLTTSVEAVSVRGSDNLFIPYAAWMALDRTERLGLAALGDWIVGMALGILLLAATARLARLTAAGGLVVFLVCTLAYALGGMHWVLPLAVLYALYLLARRRSPSSTEVDMVFPTTAGSMIVVLLYAHTDDASLYLPYLTTVAANGGLAAALLARPHPGLLPLAVVVGACVPVASALLLYPDAPFLLPAAGGLCALPLYRLLAMTPLTGRRLVASAASGLAMWFVPG